MLKRKRNNQSGFTLIEMLVAVAIFALFLTISATSLANVLKLEQKTNILRQTQQDARYILETISREARSANGEINSVGDRIVPAYIFNSGFTTLIITLTDVRAGKVTQKEYSKSGDTIEFKKKTKNIDALDSNYASEPTIILNNPNNIKIMSFSLAGSIDRLPDLSIPPKLVISIEAESGKGRYFVKDEYRAHVEFKTSVSPRNY